MSVHVFAASPAHAVVREVRKQIDAVVAALPESPSRFDRAGVAARIESAVRALYVVLDSPVEAPAHHDAILEAGRALDEAKTLLLRDVDPARDPIASRAAGVLESCAARIRRAAEEVLDQVLARRGDLRSSSLAPREPVARPFRASRAEPRLHALAKTAVAPRISLDAKVALTPAKAAPPPKAPKPKTLEELRAASKNVGKPPAEEPAPASAPPPAPAPAPADTDADLARRVARDCLEDVAALSCLRKPIPTESWLDQSPFEARLLANLDAFVAFGDVVLPSVTIFHAEAPAPDPPRGCAVALVLGSIEGEGAADVAVGTMKTAAPESLPGFVEGFRLAPSPAIDAALAEVLADPNPKLAAAALEVLAARGTLPPAAAPALLARRDEKLTLALAKAAGRALPKPTALETLTNILESQPADDIAVAACSAMLARGDGNVRQRLRDSLRARARIAASAELLALSGRADDVELLVPALNAQPTPALARAIGRFGSAAAIDALIPLLGGGPEDPLALAAAEALDRICGPVLRETAQVPWNPGVEPPDGGPPPMRTVTRVIVDRAAWEAWFARMRSRLDPRTKLRHGVPFVPATIVEELAARETPPAIRLDAARELVFATGLGLRFDTTTWVARQTRELEELREEVRRFPSAPGAWWFAGASTSR